MTTRTYRCAALALVIAVQLSAAVQIPDTPAGRVFARWLEAFNGGKREELKLFLETYSPGRVDRIDDELGFRKMTGGFDVIRIESPTDTTLDGIVKEREGSNYAELTMEVEPAAPHRIKALGLRVTERPADQAAEPRFSESDAVEALRAKLEKATQDGTFSGAVLILHNGETVFKAAYGMADREHGIRNTIGTRFRVGSMNKMFTATAIMQLVQAGKVRLDDPIGKYLKDYPNPDVASKVTVHHLLTHTGGTGDIFGPEFDKNRLELRELRDYVNLYAKRPLEFEPGSKHVYSNYGFLLLGAIIERVSGQSYYDYVREKVFKPAGMTRTDSLPENEKVEERSVGYMGRGDKAKPNLETLPYRGTSAGGGYSTVGDLVRFAQALQNGKLIDRERLALMTTGKVNAFRGNKYAYGFLESRSDGAHWFGHGGGAPGMNGDLRIYPEAGYVVAVLANMDPPAASQVSDFVDARWPVAARASAAQLPRKNAADNQVRQDLVHHDRGQ